LQWIGIDLSRRAFTVCFLDEADTPQVATFPMSPEGLTDFRKQLDPTDHVALEAGPNAYYFHDQVVAAVTRVVIVSPPLFAVIAKSTKKTDRQDAIALARFLKLDCLPAVPLPSPKIRELRQLFTTREMLVSIGRGLKNMGHAALIRNVTGSRISGAPRE
jgi:transposase